MPLRRKGTDSRSSALPTDYLKMVEEVFTTNFSEQVSTLALEPAPTFVSGGEVYADEIVVRVALVQEGRLAGTTAHASSDFDPKASSPKIEDLLSLCVDALGEVFGGLFETPSALLSGSMGEVEGLPLEWTQVDVSKRKIFVRVDKSNPVLDDAADAWLAKHDPEHARGVKESDQAAEELFVLPPKQGKKPLH
jgi:hypothetical protein